MRALALLWAASVMPLGTTHPFSPPAESAQKENNDGFALLRQHQPAPAAEAFRRALAADPAYDSARYNLATCLAAQGQWGSALGELDAVLAHNYPLYAHKVLTDIDWAPIKVLPEREALRKKLEAARSTYAVGLPQAILFVARTRTPVESRLGTSVRTFRHQEIYAFDVEAARFRQVTETEGHVVGFVRLEGGGRIAFLTSERTEANAKGQLSFADAVLQELDLQRLEAAPPRKVGPGAGAVAFAFVGGELEVRTAMADQVGHREGLSRLDSSLARPGRGEQVLALASGLVRTGPPLGPPLPQGIEVPVEAARAAWSPSRARVLLERRVAPCALRHRAGELYLLDVHPRHLQRIVQARAVFDSRWLTDEIFAFENGIGAASRVQLWRDGKTTELGAPHGAGLRALSELGECKDK